jgi:hypothetical protein
MSDMTIDPTEPELDAADLTDDEPLDDATLDQLAGGGGAYTGEPDGSGG